MWSLIASLTSSASGILIILGIAVGLLGTGAYEQHKIDAASMSRLVQSYKDASAKATAEATNRQRMIDNAALAASADQSIKQAQLAASLQAELAYAKAHATTIIQKINPACVPWGAVRILYAGSHGVPADSLALPAGQSDGACSPIGWADLAAAILHDYGQARANGARLDQLNALLRQQQAAMKEKK